jgi:hypothetical protein
MWSWGDENYSEWLGPYNSGEKCISSYIWNEKGDFKIKVKAKNIDGAESDWSDPLSFSLSKTKAIKRTFLNMIDDNPFLLRLLNNLYKKIQNKIYLD